MSYGITSTGYTVKPLDMVLQEAFDTLHSIQERTATGKGTWVWNVYKTWAIKYNEIDNVQAQIVAGMDPFNAKGFSLDQWGNEKGIFRKTAARASCIVKFTGLATPYVISIGFIVATQTGIEYSTVEQGMIPSVIKVKRSAKASDFIPAPYSGVVSISWINTTSNQTGTSYSVTTDWTYANDEITWGGASEPAEGTHYYIGLQATEEVSVDVLCQAVLPGAASSVTVGQITVNTSGLSGITAVYNDYDSAGGTDIEIDPRYVARLGRLTNTQYGYNKIASLVESIEAVRACKVYQVTGVDVAYPETDWLASSTWTTFETINVYGVDDVVYGQTFKVTGDRLTVKFISLYAKKTGTPPALRLRFYRWNTDYATTIAAGPMSDRVFKAEDVDPDNPTGWQEIQVPCRFGGLDWTATYLFTVETDDATSDVTNHWSLKYESTGAYDDGEMYVDETEESVKDMAFKTRWGGASYDVITAAKPGYVFIDWKTEIEDMILDFEKKAYGPICIQSNVIEADTAYINITAVVFISTTAEWDAVDAKIRADLDSYLSALAPGDNVLFSKVEQIMMNVLGVEKIRDCTIKKNNETTITKANEADILIANTEVAVLDSGTYGAGTDLTQGSWF